MGIQILKRDDEISHIVLEGSLDAAVINDIEQEFYNNAAAQNRSVIVDMTQVDFISSNAIRMLLASAKPLKKVDEKIVLMNPRPEIVNVIEMAGFDLIFPIVKNESEALERIAAG